MAKINCPNCRQLTSDSKGECKHCGHVLDVSPKLKKSRKESMDNSNSTAKFIILGVILIALLGVLSQKNKQTLETMEKLQMKHEADSMHHQKQRALLESLIKEDQAGLGMTESQGQAPGFLKFDKLHEMTPSKRNDLFKSTLQLRWDNKCPKLLNSEFLYKLDDAQYWQVQCEAGLSYYFVIPQNEEPYMVDIIGLKQQIMNEQLVIKAKYSSIFSNAFVSFSFINKSKSTLQNIKVDCKFTNAEQQTVAREKHTLTQRVPGKKSTVINQVPFGEISQPIDYVTCSVDNFDIYKPVTTIYSKQISTQEVDIQY